MSVNAVLMPIQEKVSRFHPTQLMRLNRSRVPRHIAIIPDGNRRWAMRNASTAQEGHQQGADILLETVKAAIELDVKVITFYAFSTENWNRSKEEVAALMALFTNYLLNLKDEMISSGIKFGTIGDLSKLPSVLKEVIENIKVATQGCNKICLVLALNYGARNELCRAFKAMLEDYECKQLEKDEINERTITRYLDTNAWPDPELLIRTSGEMRVSNFLLWQISYTEIHAAPVLWPDFKPHHLLQAILDYQERERRWGGA
jgi:undecaprenyl diphosphate synthase